MLKKISLVVILTFFAWSNIALAKGPFEFLKGFVTTPGTASKESNSKAVDLECLAKATDTREIAISAAWLKYTEAIKSALETRRSSFQENYKITDRKERRKALNQTWKTFKNARISGRRTFEQERKAAWEQFNQDKKACRATSEDTGNKGNDAAL